MEVRNYVYVITLRFYLLLTEIILQEDKIQIAMNRNFILLID